MSSSRFKNLRHSNAIAWGLHLSFLCPELIEFAGHLGFEWILLDAEHQPVTHQVARELVRAADGVGLPCVVRVPEIKASVIEGFLNVGTLGILARAVSSAADARALVEAVKFSPEGKRGAAASSRAARYGLTQTFAEYCQHSNRATFTAALIETQEGIDHLETIMAVPGIDYIAIGPNDLGLSLGITTGMADPRVRGLVETAQARARRYGMPQLAVARDADQARTAAQAGATLIAISDLALFAGAGRSFLETVSQPLR